MVWFGHSWSKSQPTRLTKEKPGRQPDVEDEIGRMANCVDLKGLC